MNSSVLRCCIFLTLTSIVSESARVNPFIVGGNEVEPNSVPYVVNYSTIKAHLVHCYISSLSWLSVAYPNSHDGLQTTYV